MSPVFPVQWPLAPVHSGCFPEGEPEGWRLASTATPWVRTQWTGRAEALSWGALTSFTSLVQTLKGTAHTPHAGNRVTLVTSRGADLRVWEVKPTHGKNLNVTWNLQWSLWDVLDHHLSYGKEQWEIYLLIMILYFIMQHSTSCVRWLGKQQQQHLVSQMY